MSITALKSSQASGEIILFSILPLRGCANNSSQILYIIDLPYLNFMFSVFSFNSKFIMCGSEDRFVYVWKSVRVLTFLSCSLFSALTASSLCVVLRIASSMCGSHSTSITSFPQPGETEMTTGRASKVTYSNFLYNNV